MRKVENWLLLESIDQHWREHLTAIDEMRQSIGLQAYAQIDPLVAFKREGYDMFQQLQDNIRRQVARSIFKVRMVEQQPPTNATSVSASVTTSAAPAEAAAATDASQQAAAKAPVLARSNAPTASQMRTNRDDAPASKGGARTATAPKVGRNDPCYCGSGIKFKKCHGA
jgi:preprotein translocase subunit SecA